MNHARKDSHREGLKLMALDEFDKALNVMLEGLQEHGPHVALLADIASCYYMLHDYNHYRQYTQLLMTEFKSCEAELSQSTCERVVLALGKLQEELGQVSQALELYNGFLGHSAYVLTNQYQMIRAQKLRLICLLNLNSEMAAEYAACAHFFKHDGHCEIDLQQALMLADFQLFGFEVANGRLQTLLQTNIRKSDRRLLIFDLLFEVLKDKKFDLIPTDYFSSVEYKDCDPFEKALWDLYNLEKFNSEFSNISLMRADDLSPLCGIRYLYLMQQSGLPESLALKARQKLLFLMQNLSLDSQNLILKQWPLKMKATESLKIEIRGSLVSVRGQSLDFAKHTGFLNLLALFANQRQWSPGDAFKYLFDADYKLENESRLRNAVTRANQKMQPILGLAKPFILKKNTLEILESLEVKVIDEENL